LGLHEFAMTKQIVENVLEEARKHNAKRVSEVHLIVGQFTFLAEEALRTAYEALVKDTILDGSKLVIEEKKGLVKCHMCGYEGTVHLSHEHEHHEELPIIRCPNCGAAVDILDGKDCVVQSVKLVV